MHGARPMLFNHVPWGISQGPWGSRESRVDVDMTNCNGSLTSVLPVVSWHTMMDGCTLPLLNLH